MPGNPIKVGPFTGGLNTYSDTTAVGDTEAVELINFDVDIDGSLLTRPPIVFDTAVVAGVLRTLGYYTSMSGEQYLLLAGVDHTCTYYYYNGAISILTNTISATSFAQYANKAWLVAPSGAVNPGGSWDPTAGFVAVSAMKKGAACVVYKERMFVGEGGSLATSSRLYFSAPANLLSWSSSDFLDVKAGDGQDIIDLIVFADVIVIFKQNSTYIYSYESKPATGQVRGISSTIGVAARDCIIEYENNLYLLHDTNVFVMANWNYERLNIKVPFKYNNSSPAALKTSYSLSLVGDRLIIRYFDNYYVYGMKTRAWTMWETTAGGSLGRFFKVPFTISGASAGTKYLATGQSSSNKSLYSFVDGFDATRTESIYWSLVTKSYDFDSPYSFKKLYWWGVDCIAKSVVNATVYPISYGQKITWGQAKLRTWGDAKSFTWGRGSDLSIQVDSTLGIQGGTNRVFIKFQKALRFRQLNLRLNGTVDGKSSTSPMRIFSLLLIADSKQAVVKTIT